MATFAAITWRVDGAKMNPTASAPIAIARSASSSVVIPQILTNTAMHPPINAAAAERARERVGSPDVTSASPTRIASNPASTRRSTSSGVTDPGLGGTRTTPAGIAAPTGSARSGSTVKVRRSRWLTPTIGGTRCERPFELRLVVDLDETVEAEFAPEAEELRKLVVVKCSDDEQDGVRSHGPRVVEIPPVDGEVLPQHRQRHRGACRGEILGAPTEVGPIGEDREAARSTPAA